MDDAVPRLYPSTAGRFTKICQKQISAYLEITNLLDFELWRASLAKPIYQATSNELGALRPQRVSLAARLGPPQLETAFWLFGQIWLNLRILDSRSSKIETFCLDFQISPQLAQCRPVPQKCGNGLKQAVFALVCIVRVAGHFAKMAILTGRFTPFEGKSSQIRPILALKGQNWPNLGLIFGQVF